MNVLTRHKLVADILNSEKSDYSLFDAGARKGVLSSLLNSKCTYTAGDKNNYLDSVSMIDLNKGLPFANSSFDYVTALDVLEHLIDPWNSFKELLRITRKKLIISLPNMAYIEFRVRFLKKGLLSGKYCFTEESVKDRHTWVTTHNEYISFASDLAKKYNLKLNITPIYPERGRTRLILTPIEIFLGDKFPNIFEYGSIFTFSKVD